MARTPSLEPGSSPDARAIFWRLFWTWCQTLFGIGLIGVLVVAALYFCGLPWGFGAILLTAWAALPLASWYFSANVVRVLTGCKPASPANHKHLRLIKIVGNLFPKTGLPIQPPVFVSPLKVPNAFATGRGPQHALIAATEGLLDLALTDDELEAVLAHELAHVKSYDIALNSLLAVMGSLFSVVLTLGLPKIFHPLAISSGSPLIDKLSDKVRLQKKRFFLPVGGFLGFVVTLVLFYLIGCFTKFISLFVTRARESAADALGAKWTGKPCALSSALQKIVIYTQTHASDLRNGIITNGMTALLLVSPFEDPESEDDEQDGFIVSVGKWWQRLGENHPPVKQRLESLDKISGSACPRLW